MTLALDNVHRSFSGVTAVAGVTLTLRRGAALAVLGPNGAGKTSVVNLACGHLRPNTGTVSVDGQDLTSQRPRAFARAGVVRTFQGLRLFETMTVLDNVLVGAHGPSRLKPGAALMRTPRHRRSQQALRQRSEEALEELGMGWATTRAVTTLSHGQRRRVELARALAARPSYLVLDEPGAGLDQGAVDQLARTLRRIVGSGVGLLLVEHDEGLVEQVADTVIALVAGAITAHGSYAEVSRQSDIAAQLEAGR